jgi:glycerol kinase
MQFTSDLTGAELRIATMADCSALGAALAGLLGLGFYASLKDLSAAPRSDFTYQPSMPAVLVERAYAGWRHAVQQVLV